ncbi:MAG: hypothetical protein ACYDAR_13295 [Thermomicrobiales bacterium]
MASERETIDISNNPDLLRLVETMRQRNASAVLTNGTENVAVVTPVGDAPKRRGKRARTQADHDAFVQAAGSWKGLIDGEQFKAYIRERRKTANRPSVKL